MREVSATLCAGISRRPVPSTRERSLAGDGDGGRRRRAVAKGAPVAPFELAGDSVGSGGHLSIRAAWIRMTRQAIPLSAVALVPDEFLGVGVVRPPRPARYRLRAGTGVMTWEGPVRASIPDVLTGRVVGGCERLGGSARLGRNGAQRPVVGLRHCDDHRLARCVA